MEDVDKWEAVGAALWIIGRKILNGSAAATKGQRVF